MLADERELPPVDLSQPQLYDFRLDLLRSTTRGRIAENLVLNDLLRRGFDAYLTHEGCAYDIALQGQTRLVKLQVKSTRGLKRQHGAHPSYRWGTLRPRRDVSVPYTEDEIDGFALVELHTEQIAYTRFVTGSSVITVRDRRVPYKYTPTHASKYMDELDVSTFLHSIGEDSRV